MLWTQVYLIRTNLEIRSSECCLTLAHLPGPHFPLLIILFKTGGWYWHHRQGWSNAEAQADAENLRTPWQGRLAFCGHGKQSKKQILSWVKNKKAINSSNSKSYGRPERTASWPPRIFSAAKFSHIPTWLQSCVKSLAISQPVWCRPGEKREKLLPTETVCPQWSLMS